MRKHTQLERSEGMPPPRKILELGPSEIPNLALIDVAIISEAGSTTNII